MATSNKSFNPVRTRTKETAKHFKISTMTLWRWRQDSTFPQPLKRGQVVLFDIAAIEQWLAGSEGM